VIDRAGRTFFAAFPEVALEFEAHRLESRDDASIDQEFATRSPPVKIHNHMNL
jgi:hypothetical protein